PAHPLPVPCPPPAHLLPVPILSPALLSPSLQVPPGFWSAPAAQSLPEGEPCPERGVLRARTRLWFEQTQAQSLGPEGELPSWFHGFITAQCPSRREAEELLQDQPLGCFLVRFSESTVGFVLSYRGRDRCRHFVLDQLPDGRYVILGERSAHAGLAQLLQHHATAPVTPYREFLTVPLPCGRVSASPESPQSPQSPCMLEYLPAQSAPPGEPIPFYAMARGWSRCASPEENIYSEVALARQDVPARPPTAPQNTFSTLPPKPGPTAGSSTAFPARTARGGSSRRLPARTGRTEELPARAHRWVGPQGR
uniref:SH2 domain containing 2A n=1 Tax=Serinus canaria TaxID=9135 RepID=A0A8C9MES5_SERCA